MQLTDKCNENDEKDLGSTMKTTLNYVLIGEFNISLSAITFASESKAIRKLNAQHLTELSASFHSQSKKKTGIQLNFPPETAVVFKTIFDPMHS